MSVSVCCSPSCLSYLLCLFRIVFVSCVLDFVVSLSVLLFLPLAYCACGLLLVQLMLLFLVCCFVCLFTCLSICLFVVAWLVSNFVVARCVLFLFLFLAGFVCFVN